MHRTRSSLIFLAVLAASLLPALAQAQGSGASYVDRWVVAGPPYTALAAGEAFFLIGDAVQLGDPDVPAGWSAAELAWGLQNAVIGSIALSVAIDDAPRDRPFQPEAFALSMATLGSALLHVTHASLRLALRPDRPETGPSVSLSPRPGGGVLSIAGTFEPGG